MKIVDLRSLLLSTSALLSVLAPGCSVPTRHEDLEFNVPVDTVRLREGVGDVAIFSDPTLTAVEVHAAVYGERTQVRSQIEEGVLTLSHECPRGSVRCAVDWEVTLPERAEPRLIDVVSDVGDVEIYDVLANVQVKADVGDVRVEGVRVSMLRIETGTGDVLASLATAPETVVAQTDVGDVAVRVPWGRYAVDLDSRVGDVRLGDGIVDDVDGHPIVLRSGVGDIFLGGQ